MNRKRQAVLYSLVGQVFCKQLCRGRRHKRMVTEIEQIIEILHKKTAPCCRSRYSAAV
ncbi:hypothetical protein HMPREF1604_00032 [Escherichia coli 908519]|uniref:Transposase n=2 Tax=Escherichia coli TaxID=562 RepID=A0A890DEZ8_ECOLX|nr:hypothetical protein HMPREF1604_00032 [Escherichia coli 908519]QRG43137.1 hypothetical protein [Escherichia coli]